MSKEPKENLEPVPLSQESFIENLKSDTPLSGFYSYFQGYKFSARVTSYGEGLDFRYSITVSMLLPIPEGENSGTKEIEIFKWDRPPKARKGFRSNYDSSLSAWGKRRLRAELGESAVRKTQGEINRERQNDLITKNPIVEDLKADTHFYNALRSILNGIGRLEYLNQY